MQQLVPNPGARHSVLGQPLPSGPALVVGKPRVDSRNSYQYWYLFGPFSTLDRPIGFNFTASRLHPEPFEIQEVPPGEEKAFLRRLRITPKTLTSNLTVTLGADPEVFLTRGGQLWPAWERLPAKGPNVEIFWDGFQAEFVTSVNTCIELFTDSIRERLYSLAAHGGTLTLQNVFEIPPATLSSISPEHAALGCAPSRNAYGEPPMVLDGRCIPYRSAGGHLHFGLPFLELDNPDQVVRIMDAILGVAGVSLAASLDNPIRRMFYGRAGEYRLPAHGLEYRVLSNFWLCHPAICHLVLEIGRAAFRTALAGLHLPPDAPEVEVRRAINNHDVGLARDLLLRNKSYLRRVFNSCNLSPRVKSVLWEVLLGGVETLVEDPHNLAKNWRFGRTWDPCSGSANCKFGSAAYTHLRTGHKV